MGLYFLLITSASVSLDSFIAGLSIGAEKKAKTQLKVLGIITVVFISCLIANILSTALLSNWQNIAVKLGGIILIAVGVAGTLNRPDTYPKRLQSPTKHDASFVFTGLGVGIDGACATVSLSLLGFGFFSVITVTAFHYLFIELGIFISNVGLKGKKPRTIIASVLLILLGLYKLM